MKILKPTVFLWLPFIFFLGFLASCSEPLVYYGEKSVTQKEFSKYLKSLDEHARRDHLRSKVLYERLLRNYASNAMLLADIHERGLDQNLEGFPAFEAFSRETLYEYLIEKWFPAKKHISLSEARRATTLYRARIFYLPSPNYFPQSLHPETEKIRAGIQTDFAAGKEFVGIGKTWVPETSLPDFAPFDLGSPYAHFVDALENAEPGEIVRELKLPNSIVYLQLVEKTVKPKDELRRLLEEGNSREAIRQALIHDRLRRERNRVVQSDFIKRNYEIFVTNRRGDLREDSELFSAGGRRVTFHEAAEKIFSGMAPSASNFLLYLEKEDGIRGMSWNLFFRKLEDLAGTVAEERHYLQLALRDPSYQKSLRIKKETFLLAHYEALYERSKKSRTGMKNFPEHLKELNLRHPLEWCYDALPEKLFFAEKKDLKRLRKDRKETAWLRFKIRLDPSSGPALRDAGKKALAKMEGAKPNAAGLTRADLILQKAFRDPSIRSHGFAVESALSFRRLGDPLRAREWLTRSRAVSDFDPSGFSRLLRTNEDKIALAALEASGFMGDVDLVPALMDIAGSPVNSPERRCFAAESLGRLPDRGQIPLLRNILKDQKELWGLRMLAGQALQSLTGETFDLTQP